MGRHQLIFVVRMCRCLFVNVVNLSTVQLRWCTNFQKHNDQDDDDDGDDDTMYCYVIVSMTLIIYWCYHVLMLLHVWSFHGFIIQYHHHYCRYLIDGASAQLSDLLRYTLSHAHLSADVAGLVSSTAMGAWVAAKAGMAVLIDHGMTTMGFLEVNMW